MNKIKELTDFRILWYNYLMAKVVKNLIKIGKEPVVILPLKEYKKFLVWQLEREYIDKIVEEGLEEERKGKTESLENFLKREFPSLYERYKKN